MLLASASRLTSLEVLKAIPGLSYRQLDYWCSRGYLPDRNCYGEGAGNPRSFSRADVERVLLLFRLGAAGVSIAQIGAAIADGELEKFLRNLARTLSTLGYVTR